jgi:two-component system, LytTR family, sensor kinase
VTSGSKPEGPGIAGIRQRLSSRCLSGQPTLQSAKFSVHVMRSTRRQSALQLAGQTRRVLCGLALFAGTIDILNHFILWSFDPDAALVPALIKTIAFWLSYIPLLALAALLADRFRLDLANSRRNLFVHLLMALTFAYVHTGCQFLVDWGVVGAMPTLPRLLRIVRLNFPIDFVSYWVIVGATYAFHYHSESHRRELAAAELKATTAALEASLAEARLGALRSQLNPHFLFNTLNAVSALALRGEPRAVGRMLARLSALLRRLLDDEGPRVTSLARELDFLNGYLELQQLWFGDRLTVRRSMDAETLDAVVPTMVLQPLVENAFVHGAGGIVGAVCVGIESVCRDGMLQLTITDNGPGFAMPSAIQKGIGLSNTEARLKELYGAQHAVEYGRTSEGGAMVTLRIPFVLAASSAAAG